MKMPMTAQLHPMSLPFFNAQPKRMRIDGKWVAASSGKTFKTINPETREVLAQVAEADGEDFDRAVKAARKEFEGTRANVKPANRQRLHLRLADLVETHADELAEVEVLNNGMPISPSNGQTPG